MATIFSFQSHSSLQTSLNAIRPNRPLGICRIQCQGNNSATHSPKNQESKPENAVLKVAWYGSELLGIAASFLRPPSDVETPVRAQELARDLSGAIPRPLIVETIKQDFGRSYFVTGSGNFCLCETLLLCFFFFNIYIYLEVWKLLGSVVILK